MPLPTGFDELAAVAVGQSVYVLGGDRGFGSAGNAVYVGSLAFFTCKFSLHVLHVTLHVIHVTNFGLHM